MEFRPSGFVRLHGENDLSENQIKPNRQPCGYLRTSIPNKERASAKARGEALPVGYKQQQRNLCGHNGMNEGNSDKKKSKSWRGTWDNNTKPGRRQRAMWAENDKN